MKDAFEIKNKSESEQEHESFASRWSRRKQQVQQEPKQDTSESILADIKSQGFPEDLESPQKTPEEQRLEALNALTDEDMPDIKTLGEDSDYSGFMSINVSEELRKIALKKLFHGKSYNLRDGLDEYDGNYSSSNFEKLDPAIITCDMKHLLKVEAEKLLAKEAEEKQNLEQEFIVLQDSDDDILDQLESTDEIIEPDLVSNKTKIKDDNV